MRIAVLALFLLAACSGPKDETSGPVQPIAAKVFSGGTIYTGLEGAEIVETVAVGADGRILWTGLSADLEAAIDTSSSEMISLDGAVMFPGLTDAHAHLFGIGERELTLDLTDIASIEALVAGIESEIEDLEPGIVLVGRGWIETAWPEGRMPLASDLDDVSPDNPVILVRSDGHAMVINTAALNAVGIGVDTSAPVGGRIERDEENNATGIIIDNAMSLVTDLISIPSETEALNTLAKGAEVYVSRGWTGMHNMSVDPAHAPLLERLDNEGKLPLRLHNAYDEVGFEIAARRRYETDTITNRAVKIYIDGALGSRGALLTEPYTDRPEEKGLSLRSGAQTQSLLLAARQRNVQIAIHAIGDLGNRRALDWMEAVEHNMASAPPDKRWRIEHAQILHAEDIPRFAELGVIASMQPSHAIGDLHFAEDRLGLDRLEGAYAWRAIIDAGGVLAGGSDAPVEVGSPLIEFYAAVARKDMTGFSGAGWHPEQAVTREEALKMFTVWPAFASFQENELGTIEVGKLADFSVFDTDLMTVPEAEILEAEAVMTVIGGDVVWRAN
ncbi:MAG: amidohydrolase [Hyphomonadaceae bacterium]